MNTHLPERGVLFISSSVILLTLSIQAVDCTMAQERPAQQRLKAGETATVDIQTPHPYPNGDDTQPAVWVAVIHSHKATFIKVHFENFSVEGEMGRNVLDKDFVLIKDKNGQVVDQLTGTARANFWGSSVDGDTAIIELHSDKENNSYGFDITEYGYGLEHPVEVEPFELE